MIFRSNERVIGVYESSSRFLYELIRRKKEGVPRLVHPLLAHYLRFCNRVGADFVPDEPPEPARGIFRLARLGQTGRLFLRGLEEPLNRLAVVCQKDCVPRCTSPTIRRLDGRDLERALITGERGGGSDGTSGRGDRRSLCRFNHDCIHLYRNQLCAGLILYAGAVPALNSLIIQGLT